MITSNEGIALIKKHEGLELKAYKPVPTERYYTIGYGHNGPDVHPDSVITAEHAEALLIRDLCPVEAAINQLIREMNTPLPTAHSAPPIPLTQSQFDALASFIYNVGTAAFSRSTLRRLIIARAAAPDIAAQFLRWNKSGGRTLPGLTRRREAEAALWIS